jgi:hypothetical protein
VSSVPGRGPGPDPLRRLEAVTSRADALEALLADRQLLGEAAVARNLAQSTRLAVRELASVRS